LGFSTPTYLHVPVVLNQAGEKLSKQTGALAFDRGDNDVLHEALLPAASFLGLQLSRPPNSIEDFWSLATDAWALKIALQ
jgi:glutamyl-Q tRNA(Asp) synthetase